MSTQTNDQQTGDAETTRSIEERIAAADISAALDAQVDAHTGSIEARSEHAELCYREEDVFGDGGEPTVSAFSYQGDERATLSVYMGLDRDNYASATLDAEGCREVAAQLLRAADELEAADR